MSIVNLHADQVGNPQLPKKFQALKRHRARMRWAATTAALLALAAIVAGIAMFSRNRVRSKASSSHDVDEQDMSDLDLDLFLNLSGHISAPKGATRTKQSRLNSR